VISTRLERHPVGVGPDRDLEVPAVYATEVTHTRRSPITNHFRYRASHWLVDFDRLPRSRGIKGCLARFERADHCDVRALLAQHDIAAESILMLAVPRTLGYVFNPITVFWCYDVAGKESAVVAEVHNTYGESHGYLLRPDAQRRAAVDKALYVSPFYPVDGSYDIAVSEPGRTVTVAVTLRRAGAVHFAATLEGRRRTTDEREMVRRTLLHSALRTSVLIRWQALRLWWHGLRVQPR